MNENISTVVGISPISISKNQNLFEMIIVEGNIIFQSCVSVKLALAESRITFLKNMPITIDDVKRRYRTMEKNNIEKIKSELEDDYSDDSLFNISSWGADLSFRELVSMYEDDELIKPELQRKYVWDKMEASRFIESILLGLPVPSIFLAQSGSQKLIVDGYQRLMTVYDYIRGIFSADEKVFKLANSERINVRWRNKAFAELNTDDQRKIKSTTIHAIIFEQKKPQNDDTSLYQIFERINTSGRTLTPQEIRNCVYQGALNTMLFELNENQNWRKLFGAVSTDSRMRDLEYILRFLAMKTDDVLKSTANQISLKKTLNTFMENHKNGSVETINEFKQEFESVIELIYNHIGENAFRNLNKDKFSNKFHPAIFDAIMIATFLVVQQGQEISDVSIDSHIELFSCSEFRDAISKRTTNVDNINTRIKCVARSLYGVEL